MPSTKDLKRLFEPKTIAIVGASENQPRVRNIIEYAREQALEYYLVNPVKDEVLGIKTYKDLHSIGKPLDAVFCSVRADRVEGVIRAAVDLRAGGVVVNSGGFAETGEEGALRQRKLVELAGAMPLLGPNCNGFIAVNRAVRLSGAPHLPILDGNVAFVTHSGALLSSAGVTGHERRVGFSYLISTGNEAAVTMADCISYLADEPETKVICLAIESIRDADAFFDAVAKARRANKPVIALKLGRSAKARQIAISHTGSITSEAWIYDAVLAQHGVIVASDLLDLLDRTICFAQIPAEKWSAAKSLAVVTASGGGAGLASDLAAELKVKLPDLERLRPAIQKHVPGAEVVNPLDMTGFALGRKDAARELLNVYLQSDEVDGVLVQWFLDDSAHDMGAALLTSFAELAPSFSKPAMLGSVDDGPIGDWAASLAAKGLAVGRGMRSSLRALKSMGEFMRFVPGEPDGSVFPWKAALRHDDFAGPSGMLPFRHAMALLQTVGFDVAGFFLVEPSDSPEHLDIPFSGPFVVKLADVPHRTELQAVKLGVAEQDISSTVCALHALAEAHRMPATVVIQSQLSVSHIGEAFIGIQNEGELAPTVVFGIGGILVELLKVVTAGRAPLSDAAIERMLDEIAHIGVFEGFRGAAPWNRAAVRKSLQAASRLATAIGPEVGSIDINPLIVSADGCVAVDALFISTAPTRAGS